MNFCSRTSAIIAACSMQPLARFLSLATTLVLVSTSANVTDAPERIPIPNSYNYTLPGTTIISQGARARLFAKSAKKIETKAVYLFAARYSEPEREPATSAFLRDGHACADQPGSNIAEI